MHITPISSNKNPSFSSVVKVKPPKRLIKAAANYDKHERNRIESLNKKEVSWFDAGVKEGAIASGALLTAAALLLIIL